MPAASERSWHQRHLSARAERRFNIASSVLIVGMAIGWSWSIANASDEVAFGVPTTAGILSRALTDTRSPSVAFLTDAALDLVTPLRGESGKLRANLQNPGGTIADSLPTGAVATFSSGVSRVKADSGQRVTTPIMPGIWSVAVAVGDAIRPVVDFSVITLKPASAERGGRIGLYFIGKWPSARKTARATYIPPSGFIEVTPEKQDTYLSDHLRLRDFLPHDQANVWPKYIVVNLNLVDKLELVMTDLEAHGIPARGIRVLSGFRTPQYNRTGGDPKGRASLSRHMYGDAADIFIDNDGNGNMDDLSHDGRVNLNDARVVLEAVNRVEAAHPSLIGGCGVYAGTSAHGPFIHIDTRGYPARWLGTGDN
ncbi:MAG: D-Ala-D-Ala carboxypeptidase family metallohydrolase [Gemmatimonadaceae bacterium]